MAAKAQKSHGARSELNSVFSLEKVDHPPYSPWRCIELITLIQYSFCQCYVGPCQHGMARPHVTDDGKDGFQV
jgi:hypothetical protein